MGMGNSSTATRLDSSPTSKQQHKHQHFSICVPQLSFSAASASLHSSLRQVHKAAAASSRPSSRPSRARQPFCPAPSPPLRSFPPLSCRPPLVRRPLLRCHRSLGDAADVYESSESHDTDRPHPSPLLLRSNGCHPPHRFRLNPPIRSGRALWQRDSCYRVYVRLCLWRPLHQRM